MNRMKILLFTIFLIFPLFLCAQTNIPKNILQDSVNPQREIKKEEIGWDFTQNQENYSKINNELDLLQILDLGLPPSGRNGSYLGEKVTNIGDVNNDGYDDWAIGLKDAAIYETSQKLGKVYIYFGSATPLSEQDPNLILTGESDGDHFGQSVSFAGDLNNDGYDDVIVGAPDNDAAAKNAGRSYIFFGGNVMDSIPDVILIGESSYDCFGTSVSFAGDVNNDGYDDVIVGATYGHYTGSSYIYYGGTMMDSIADVTLTGEASNDNFGNSVSFAGDVNNDGYDDVIVGASENDAAGGSAGRSYLYFGSSSMDSLVDVILTGEAAYDYFGKSVSFAGDVNNDGYDDVIIGADRSGYMGVGYAQIFFGNSTMDSIADVTLTGSAWNGDYGECVSLAGDVNNDGYDDVIVGAKYEGTGGSSYIYFGSSTMNNIADVILTGASSADNFGYSVSCAGDINSDGYDDVIVGAPFNDAGGLNSGRSCIYFGGSAMNNTADVTLTGVAMGDWFGFSVSFAGDVNNDGYDDIIIGADGIEESDYHSAIGHSYIFLGSSTMDDSADVTLTGASQGDYFGYSISYAGDVNNDGYDDVIVGAHWYDWGIYSNTGRSYIYFGGSTMNNTPDVILTGEYQSNFGKSVSYAGDVNNDGYDDVIVGAIFGGGNWEGRSYIFFGGNPMDNIADVILTGESDGDRFGSSVSFAGDVNNDGYDDVIVGAPSNGAGGTSAGRSYIYFGNSIMDDTADVIFTGEAWGDKFGKSVSFAGDVNNDGYDDVIVGALYAGTGGHSYIYYGSSMMDNTPDVILSGESSNENFGNSVSNAGDVNNDGYDDVVVGSKWNYSTIGQLATGRSYLFFGSNTMDDTADVIFTGEALGDFFGISVSYAGDVNNDGYDDVINGAYGNSAIGYRMGRAYVYKGEHIPVGIINSKDPISNKFFLSQNYPNPFNPSTKIQFSIPIPTKVTITIYDNLGREVKRLINQNIEPGIHTISWDGKNNSGSQTATGIYFLRMQAGNFVETNKLLLVK